MTDRCLCLHSVAGLVSNVLSQQVGIPTEILPSLSSLVLYDACVILYC